MSLSRQIMLIIQSMYEQQILPEFVSLEDRVLSIVNSFCNFHNLPVPEIKFLKKASVCQCTGIYDADSQRIVFYNWANTKDNIAEVISDLADMLARYIKVINHSAVIKNGQVINLDDGKYKVVYNDLRLWF